MEDIELTDFERNLVDMGKDILAGIKIYTRLDKTKIDLHGKESMAVEHAILAYKKVKREEHIQKTMEALTSDELVALTDPGGFVAAIVAIKRRNKDLSQSALIAISRRQRGIPDD